ncbi:glutamate/aspartate ABC transporter substrate-binding protein [Pseudogulbenkiania subflava]|uniref:Glutamate/aspartate transport system substrate-binding protein n=1 Tax=Pseudogulbenkiania subflava DSM 22618 TaxID=1123014 RepID=A0A1Y6BVD2_9NEIS|nr:glutamate/aspartate ABC transporter substrate-binding protein [Pseudogulbenkiania subflava]SMF29233.1 glutamate/aspartate transport system substrate-binding protein [Pseudogulbenkiania subflava DSM 22618]
MSQRFTRTLLASGLAAACLTAPAFAAEPAGTLQKIKESGSIVLAYRDASIPFSYLDNNQQPVGYSVDIANKVVEAVKKELKLPSLKVQYNLVTSQTRIPLVQNGTVDLECGSTTNNLERQKQVDFSLGFFLVKGQLLTKKSSGIKDFADLKGKNVVTTAGTTNERLLKVMNADKQMGMNVISAKDHGEAFMIVESGRAAAFYMDNPLLYGEMAKARNPAEWTVTGKPQSFESYGCMLRKGDPAFKKVVDDALRATYQSGEINKIYAKWFTSPVPPKGLNLNFPMSDELKAFLKNPTDRPSEQL